MIATGSQIGQNYENRDTKIGNNNIIALDWTSVVKLPDLFQILLQA